MRINIKGLGATWAVLLSGLLAAVPGPVPARAAAGRPSSHCEIDVARAVASQLEKAPDGRFVPPNVISYEEGAEVITFRPPSCGAARRSMERDCDEDGVLDNAVCLYDRRAFEGSRQAIKVTGTRKLNGTSIIMSIKSDRPFVFFVKRNPGERGACFPPGQGRGDASYVGEQRWVNAHPAQRECHTL